MINGWSQKHDNTFAEAVEAIAEDIAEDECSFEGSLEHYAVLFEIDRESLRHWNLRRSAQLKRALRKSGLSQRGAAKALGINERTMRRYISGEMVIPRVVEYAVRWIIEHPTSGDSNG